MSHIVSLRGTSLRALLSTSTVVAASKCTTYPNRSCQHQQQYSYSTLPPRSNRILITDKSTKRVRIYQMSHKSIYRRIINNINTIEKYLNKRIYSLNCHFLSRHSQIKHFLPILLMVQFIHSIVVFIQVQYFVCYLFFS
jgi:hypothetical protein